MAHERYICTSADEKKRLANERFDEILESVKGGQTSVINAQYPIESATFYFLSDKQKALLNGELTQYIFDRLTISAKMSFVNGYFRELMTTEVYENTLFIAKEKSQEITALIKGGAEMTAAEWVERLIKIVGICYNEVDEKMLSEKWQLSQNEKKEKKTPKAKKSTGKKNTAFDFDCVVKEYFTAPETLEFLRQWHENRRAKKGIVDTESAIRRNLERVKEFAKQSEMTVDEYLSEVVRLGWAAMYPFEGGVSPKKRKKETAFSSNASYDLEAFLKNSVSLKYADANK